ncbi:protein pal1 [Podospora aff. communis PSN243]|uniref:Protein pal1 n=1 Tax=Podospora aff. communis PSN243 TaxID=3040156 RepID=A0AAV9G9Z1_9PEZI|nr:protein pal1 [Podospora aff. communis PSN243]
MARIDKDYGDEPYDKQWANNYILGPLYEPEPSQVCATRVSKALPPTPPGDSPTRQGFQFRRLRSASQENEDPDDQPLFRRIISRSNSVLSRTNSVKSTNKPLPPSPPPRPKPRPLSDLERKRSVHTSRPPQTQWNQGTILARANSVATSRPSLDAGNMPDNATRRRGSSLAERYPGDRSHRPLDILTQEHRAKEVDPDAPLPRRGGSLRQRYPGDMSHRPLDMIKREHRAADHAPHLRTHRRQQPSDPIDLLDHTGPLPDAVYHHEGPFDPAMKSKNTNKMYSPVEAVKDTNIEALKATPVEFLKDSLDKHVPLQGTAIVPPGMKDMAGRTMEYEEGADLMREKDAAGGAYKRWDHIPYKDEDLKGKGEPSFTIEKDNKGKQVNRKPLPANGQEYEMQPTASATGHSKLNGTNVNQRRVSLTDQAPPPPPKDYPGTYGSGHSAGGGLQRSNTTGKSFTQLIKRRFGSLRRRKDNEERAY